MYIMHCMVVQLKNGFLKFAFPSWMSIVQFGYEAHLKLIMNYRCCWTNGFGLMVIVFIFMLIVDVGFITSINMKASTGWDDALIMMTISKRWKHNDFSTIEEWSVRPHITSTRCAELSYPIKVSSAPANAFQSLTNDKTIIYYLWQLARLSDCRFFQIIAKLSLSIIFSNRTGHLFISSPQSQTQSKTSDLQNSVNRGLLIWECCM